MTRQRLWLNSMPGRVGSRWSTEWPTFPRSLRQSGAFWRKPCSVPGRSPSGRRHRPKAQLAASPCPPNRWLDARRPLRGPKNPCRPRNQAAEKAVPGAVQRPNPRPRHWVNRRPSRSPGCRAGAVSRGGQAGQETPNQGSICAAKKRPQGPEIIDEIGTQRLTMPGLTRKYPAPRWRRFLSDAWRHADGASVVSTFDPSWNRLRTVPPALRQA